MHTQNAVEYRNEQNVNVYESLDDGPPQICSTTDRFVLLKEMPWAELQRMVRDYADAHDAAMLEFFLQPGSNLRKPHARVSREWKVVNYTSPEALQIQGQATVNSVAQVSGKYCSTHVLRNAVQSEGLLAGYELKDKAIVDAWRVVGEPYEVQRRVAEQMVRPKIRTMAWAKPSRNLDLQASAYVLDLLDKHSSTLEFLEALCAPLAQWFNSTERSYVKGSRGTLARRPLVAAWLAMWLAERGVLLFPLSVITRRTELLPLRYRTFFNWICLPERRQSYEDFQSRMSAMRQEKRGGDRASALSVVLNLVAPGVGYGQNTAERLRYLKAVDGLFSEDALTISTMWRLEAVRLKSLNVDAQLLQSLTDKVIQRKAAQDDSVLWSWVDNPRAHIKSGARYARKNFAAGPNLIAHVQELREIFPGIAGRSAFCVGGRLSIWLLFLSHLNDEVVPPRVVDIAPGLISSVRVANGSSTLLGFAEANQVPFSTKRGLLNTLKRAWKLSARQAGEESIICPINDQLALVDRSAERRHSSSTRRAIDMDILELLIEENRVGDFSFSRARAHSGVGNPLDHRWVFDPETERFSFLWWPGIAVLMDVLLQIPLRHKQGRFLDSGEGDECIVDLDTLELRPNLLATATKNRNQAFIQRVSMSPLRDEPGVGMYVNTNKTGKDYLFPWLLRDIAVNVKRVIEWQVKYNPITAPISDRENTKEERAANAQPNWVYPIFRDPERHDHVPVSGGVMLEYFRALLAHVETKYNLINNTSIRFFRPNGDPVYDIHSLRVTGVTRLLSMGVDPKIVRLLVGHASMAMTWYYEHITNQRVASAIERALEQKKPTREGLLQMSLEERERFLSRLFNRSDQPVLAIGLLRNLVEERAPFLDMRVDGICPGQSCTDAGVWRPRACSLCKYNITGAPFLAGLELVLNNLMAELILKQKSLAELRDDLYRKRKEGLATRALAAEIAKHEEVVDSLLQEWEAQFQYVKRAEADLGRWLDVLGHGSEKELSLLSPDAEKMGVALQETHHLGLLTRLVEGAKNVEGFMPTVGAREARDAMLLEIVRHENKTGLFYKLDPHVRKIALDQFALLLMEEELSVEKTSALIEGTAQLSELPSATKWLNRLGGSDGQAILPAMEQTHE